MRKDKVLALGVCAFIIIFPFAALKLLIVFGSQTSELVAEENIKVILVGVKERSEPEGITSRTLTFVQFKDKISLSSSQSYLARSILQSGGGRID